MKKFLTLLIVLAVLVWSAPEAKAQCANFNAAYAGAGFSPFAAGGCGVAPAFSGYSSSFSSFNSGFAGGAFSPFVGGLGFNAGFSPFVGVGIGGFGGFNRFGAFGRFGGRFNRFGGGHFHGHVGHHR